MGADSKSCLSFSRWAERSFVSGPLWGRSPSGKGTGTNFGGGAGGFFGAGFTDLVAFTDLTAFRCLPRTLLVRVRRRDEVGLLFDLLLDLDLDRLAATRAFDFFNSRLLPKLTSVQMAGTLGTGIVNVNHLDFRVEIKRGGPLLSVANPCCLDATKGYVGLTTRCRGVDVGNSRFDGIYESKHPRDVAREQ